MANHSQVFNQSENEIEIIEENVLPQTTRSVTNFRNLKSSTSNRNTKKSLEKVLIPVNPSKSSKYHSKIYQLRHICRQYQEYKYTDKTN